MNDLERIKYQMAKAMVQRQVEPRRLLSMQGGGGHRRRHKRRHPTINQQMKKFRDDKIGNISPTYVPGSFYTNPKRKRT